MNIKILIALIGLISSVSAFAADGDTFIEGKSDYICIINGENPSEENTFDQTLFSGEVLNDGGDRQEMFFNLESKSQIKVDLEKVTPDQIKSLDGVVIFSIFLTPSTENDNSRYLQLTLGRIDASSPGNQVVPLALGRGYHKKNVLVIDQINKVSASCFHKSDFGL